MTRFKGGVIVAMMAALGSTPAVVICLLSRESKPLPTHEIADKCETIGERACGENVFDTMVIECAWDEKDTIVPVRNGDLNLFDRKKVRKFNTPTWTLTEWDCRPGKCVAGHCEGN